ncbi:hypothetical protein H1C71_012043, partial [Ictidomys tridecemlineatus]
TAAHSPRERSLRGTRVCGTCTGPRAEQVPQTCQPRATGVGQQAPMLSTGAHIPREGGSLARALLSLGSSRETELWEETKQSGAHAHKSVKNQKPWGCSGQTSQCCGDTGPGPRSPGL